MAAEGASLIATFARACVGILAVTFALSGGNLAGADDRTNPLPASRTLTPAELAQMLKAKDFFLVNVLPTYQGEIPQTDAFINYENTRARLGEYPRDKTAKIVVYCLTGRTSAIALGDLLNAGYTNARVLEGGMQAWEHEARPILHRSAAPALPYPSASGQPPGPVPEGCPCGLEPAAQ